MAAKTLIAWSPIRHGGKTVDGVVQDVKVIKAGDKVSRDTIKGSDGERLSDENWNAMIEAGVLRPYAYPDLPEGYTGSPVQFLMEQARQAAEAPEEMLAATVNQAGSYFGPNAEEVLLGEAELELPEQPQE